MPLVRVDCSKLGGSPKAWKDCVTKRPIASDKHLGPFTVVEYTVEDALALIIELLAQPAPKRCCCPPKRPWVPPPGFAPAYVPAYVPAYAPAFTGRRKGC